MANLDLERRAEIGAAKRARTREQVIEAALRLVLHRAPEVPSLEDFVSAAGVARGTFYNHFRTKELLLKEASAFVADAIDAEILPLCKGIEDPARRVSIAMRRFIDLARERPQWGWMLVHAQPQSGAGWSEGMRRGVLADIRAGHRSGRFRVSSVQAAAALGVGALANAIRTTLTERTKEDFSRQMAAMTLQALGIGAEEACRIVTIPLPTSDAATDSHKSIRVGRRKSATTRVESRRIAAA